MKPLLAHVYEPHRVTYPCYVQPKLNGIRALYQNGHFQSRDELPFAEPVLRHLSEPLKKIFGPDVILDGELYVHGWPLQRINAAVTPVRQEPTEDSGRVQYHIFDVVCFDESFADRRLKPGMGIPETGLDIRRVSTRLAFSEEEANDYYADFVGLGYEGMMYRLGDCPYTVPKQPGYDWWKTSTYTGTFNKRSKFLSDKDNRCWHLLKRKNWQDDEFDFLSLVETIGDLGEPGFQMTLQSKSSVKPTFNVGSGLTRKDVETLLANPPHGRKVKVKYLCLSSDGIPLNPTILAVL